VEEEEEDTCEKKKKKPAKKFQMQHSSLVLTRTLATAMRLINEQKVGEVVGSNPRQRTWGLCNTIHSFHFVSFR
jgi:hypothetical protein